MSTFSNKNFIGFRNYLKRNKYDYFCVVMDQTTGQYDFHGDLEMAQIFLNKKQRENRKNSYDWLPETEIKMPKPLEQILNNVKDVRQFSSYLLHHFLGNKQKLGQVMTSIDHISLLVNLSPSLQLSSTRAEG